MARVLLALVVVSSALWHSNARAQSDERASADAKVAAGISQAAVAVYAAGHYREAINLFVEANRLRPSAALSFNIARCYEQLHDPRHAIEWYRDYLERSEDAGDALSVKARIARLTKRLAERRDST
jgi:tetratricopeptide (TPR) repeat protein